MKFGVESYYAFRPAHNFLKPDRNESGPSVLGTSILAMTVKFTKPRTQSIASASSGTLTLHRAALKLRLFSQDLKSQHPVLVLQLALEKAIMERSTSFTTQTAASKFKTTLMERNLRPRPKIMFLDGFTRAAMRGFYSPRLRTISKSWESSTRSSAFFPSPKPPARSIALNSLRTMNTGSLLDLLLLW